MGITLPTLQELYSSRVSKRAVKITLDPHIQHTASLNCYRLIDATELWEQPDTETVSSLRQSISWTCDIKRGTHTIYTLIYLTHILSLHFNLHIIYLYIQNVLLLYTYTYNCQFEYCYSLFTCSIFIICVFVLSLSFCCTVEASVTKTNSLNIPGNKAHCDSDIAFSSVKVISSESGEKYAQIKHRLQVKTIWCEGKRDGLSLEQALLWYFGWKQRFKVKTS